MASLPVYMFTGFLETIRKHFGPLAKKSKENREAISVIEIEAKRIGDFLGLAINNIVEDQSQDEIEAVQTQPSHVEQNPSQPEPEPIEVRLEDETSTIEPVVKRRRRRVLKKITRPQVS